MAFPENFLNELVERNDIVEVVSSYVRLSKKSGSNLFGLCPFHSEKTPSFSVSPDKQIYHCFGCGKGGGVINFIMEIENLSFPEAVEFLAKRVNMPMPVENNDRESRQRARLLALNKDAARFYLAQLRSENGRVAQDYMYRRRIGRKTATNFGLGYAPDTWDSLRNAMKALGYSDVEMYTAGLLRKGRNGGYYDVFRNRLMFPVIDVRGNVIGFSGRILGDGEPKYMNSPETPVFSKSRNLFGLNLAKKSKDRYIILSEGNIDVVALHQAGFDSAVASLGTSLTSEQARLISRYKNEVIIAYDNDGAGQSAAKRAIGILEKLDVKVKVLRLKGAKDPDEFIKLKGPDSFRQLLEDSENQLDYRLRTVKDKYDLSIDEQKVDFLNEATNLLAQFPDPLARQVYASKLAEMVSLKEDVVGAEVERRRKKFLFSKQRSYEKEQTRPAAIFQPQERELRYENPYSAVAEEGIIRLLYLEPALAENKLLIPPEQFSSPVLGHIYSVILNKIRLGGDISTATLSDELSSQEMSLLVNILHKPEELSQAERCLRDYINKIREQQELSGKETDLNALAEKFRERKGFEG